jgi:hypothetical protein
MNKKDLWLRLKAYHFNHLVPPHLWIKVTAAFGGEGASTKAFADKIARKPVEAPLCPRSHKRIQKIYLPRCR